MKKSQDPIDVAEQEEARLILAPDIPEMFGQQPNIDGNYSPRVVADELVDLAAEITEDEVEERLLETKGIGDLNCRNRVSILKKMAYLHPDSSKSHNEIRVILQKIRQMPIGQRASFMNEVAQGAFDGKDSDLLDRELRGWGREDLIKLYKLYTQQREHRQVANKISGEFILGEKKMDLNKIVSKVAKSLVSNKALAFYSDVDGWNMEDEAQAAGFSADVWMNPDEKSVTLKAHYINNYRNHMTGHSTDEGKSEELHIDFNGDVDELAKEIHTKMYHFAGMHGGRYDPKSFKWATRDSAKGTMRLSTALKKSLGVMAPKPSLQKLEEPSDFNRVMKEYLAHCQAVVDKDMEKYAPQSKTLSMDNGQRYVRIVATDGNGSSRYVYGFVDKTNGDILKAAGWKAPAKHARGNIYDKSTWKNSATGYGVAYMR